MRGWGTDLRLAARRLLATPLFTIFSVLSLAVGIGVTTVAYSAVDLLFFPRLGIDDPASATYVLGSESGRLRVNATMSRADFEDLRGSVTSFTSLAASLPVSPSLVGPSATELVRAEAVTGNYFQTLGVPPMLGRTIAPADDDPPAPVAVLSYELWRGRFAADSQILGRTVRIGGHPFEIVGVAPKTFVGAGAGFGAFGTRLWIPLGAASQFATPSRWLPRSPAAPVRPDRERRDLMVLGRLRSGIGVERAAAEIAHAGATLDAAYPNTIPYAGTQTVPRRVWTARTIADVRTEESENGRRVGFVVAGLVLMVLVVACTNLANLVVSRGTTRRQEIAVRRALGAARWRLVREQTSESVLIALAGGVGAWLLMRGLVFGLAVDLPVSPSSVVSFQPTLDASMLIMAAGALVTSLLVFGLEPAIQLTRTGDVRDEISHGSGIVGAPRASRQRMLLRWQVAVSTGFFILASLAVRFVFVEFRHDPGLQVDRFGVAMLNFYAQGWDETRVHRALDRIVEEAARQPDLRSVALSTGLPMGTITPTVRFSTPDKPLTGKNSSLSARLVAATPGVFATIGVPILRGRGFDDRDAPDAAIVVVNEVAARLLFGTSDVVGRQMLLQVSGRGQEQPIRTMTIVGVARDTDTSYLQALRGSVVYAPLTRYVDPFMTLTARAASDDAAAAVAALRRAIRRADPDVAIDNAGSGRTLLTGPYALLRFIGISTTSLGLLTLLLAMAGLYGIQSNGVAQRTREIGVRMSLGATASRIKRMVLKDGYRPVVEGMAIGVFIGLSGRGIIRAYLDVKLAILDPWIIAIVPIPVVLAAFLACYLPARRAAAVDPNTALRHL
jgi:predicted permease